MRRRDMILLAASGWLLMSSLTGCESLQRKLTRKSKQPQARPNPIIQFQDYSRAMTPLDRYRKHYMIFDYWNSDLLESLQRPPLNPKRYRRASSDALGELQALQGLLTEELAERLAPLIEERTKLDSRLQRGGVSDSQVLLLQRDLEAQTRRFQREFFWRKMEDHLKPQAPAAP